jgi:GxxExxY protein
MNADEREYLEDVTKRVIGAAFEVSNVLGAGFAEKVYENALVAESRMLRLRAEPQQKIEVRYKGMVVGDYYPDILVEDQLIIELKCCSAFTPDHTAQCLNYLRATGLHLALLFNFQKPKIQFKRLVLDL